MSKIPSHCPKCGSTNWSEDINPLTTGIPVGEKIRISIVSINGLFAGPLKRRLGFYDVRYSCGKCGFTKKYPLE